MPPNLPVGTPLWWLARLHGKLADLHDPLHTLSDYYEGKHPLAFATPKYRRAFDALLRNLSDNWCGVVVDAVEERLNVQGFRIHQEGASDALQDSPGDQVAWTIWQRNNMDAGSQMAHLEALIKGYSNILVWGDSDGKALITPEDPTQTYVEMVPGSRTERAAAIKEWRDDWTGDINATLYLPDLIYKYRAPTPKVEGGGEPALPQHPKWEPRVPEDEPWPLPNPLGVVPMVPLENRPRMLDRCDSEIRTVIPLQNACNKLVADMLVASEFQAFRQRWATGLEIPLDPETDQPVEPFAAAIDRLWISESAETQFGEFQQADLRVFVNAIETVVQHVATQTRTPPHYFYLSGQFPSGESIKAAETGLVSKSRRKMVPWGDTHEEVMRLAFLVEGDERANATSSETIWEDPESRSEAEHTDAMIKLKALSVPDEALWERWGFSPTEISRFKEQRAEQALYAPTVTEGLPGGVVAFRGTQVLAPPAPAEANGDGTSE